MTLVPVFIVLFKLGTQMEIATIAFGTVWPILLNTIDGAASVDPVQMETGAGVPAARLAAAGLADRPRRPAEGSSPGCGSACRCR